MRLPDISTSTKDYLEIKELYKHEHERNKIVLLKIIGEIFPNYKVDEYLLGEYVNNIDGLKIVKMRPYFEELESPDVTGACMEYLGDAKSLFITLRTYKSF